MDSPVTARNKVWQRRVIKSTEVVIDKSAGARGTVMRGQTLATAVALGWVAVALAGDDPPIPPADAVKKIGQTVRVEMAVKKAKDGLEKHGLIYLDSEDDFHSPSNLGVAITPSGAGRFRAKGIADPATYLLGKAIRVRGEILVFETRPYLPVTDPAQIEVLPQRK